MIKLVSQGRQTCSRRCLKDGFGTSWSIRKFNQRDPYKDDFPQSCKVVICGGGMMGASVAYHLTELGWGADTILVEQGRLGSGITWNSSGLVGVFKPTLAQVEFSRCSALLYEQLAGQGHQFGWKKCGSLNLARTKDRMTVFKRMKAISGPWGIDCELVNAEEAKRICPLIRNDDLQGGLWIPGDSVADPYALCVTLVKLAKERGVRVAEECSIERILSENGRIKAVKTSRGEVQCEYFVNCAGFWARRLGQMSNPSVRVPVQAAHHYFLKTRPIPGLDWQTPVVRDPDGHIYFRELDGCLLGGGFEPEARIAFEDGSVPSSNSASFYGKRLAEDWDHFHQLLEEMLRRLPALRDAELDKLINSPETFSPDCKWIIGEAPEMMNYFVAAGMKTVGIAAAGGVGKATAEWIVNGKYDRDIYELDISRFLDLHNNLKYLKQRVKEVPGLHYKIPYPGHEFESGRWLRMSPVFLKLHEAGAVFGQMMGYERPSWFDSSGVQEWQGSITDKFRIAKTETFSKPSWFDKVLVEYEACREAVGLSDYSTFTKIDLRSSGNEVVEALQYLCSNNVDVPVGSIIHTGMQNASGGYENDCSLARLSHNHYMMIAPTIQQTRCKAWIRRNISERWPGAVTLSDVTSMFTAICIMGPFARSLLQELTDTDLSPHNFPFFTYKEMDVGMANGIRVMNLTHTGELGYVLYIPNEFALHVYNCLIEYGAKYDLKHAGYYAMRSLRIEKFFAFWGLDLDTTTTPLECGRSWRVKFDDDVEFIGKEALLRQRDEGVRRLCVQLLLGDEHDPEIDLWCSGAEPIYRDGRYCGVTTTTSYGYTFKKLVCLGFVQNIDENGKTGLVDSEYILSGKYEVNIAGVRYPAKVNLHSPILPTKYPDKERQAYFATRDKMTSEPLLRPSPVTMP